MAAQICRGHLSGIGLYLHERLLKPWNLVFGRAVAPDTFAPHAVVLADAARDGRRTGVDAEMYARARATFPRSRIIASGGIAGPEDLCALRRLGVGGAVLGSSLYHGTLTLAEAKEAVR